jgi:hypothetical protein
MADIKNQAPQGTTPNPITSNPIINAFSGGNVNAANAINGIEKVIAEQTARFETVVADLGKLQTKGLAQAQTFFENATRVTQEQIAFAEQLGGEWRKVVLAATRSAGELFAPKG